MVSGGEVDYYPANHQALVIDGGALQVRNSNGVGIALYSPHYWLCVGFAAEQGADA
jgi:hypothetical protein